MAASFSKSAAAFALLAMSAQAHAMVPPPPVCNSEPGATEPYAYDPRDLGNGFAYFDSYPADDMVLGLEYCPTRQQLLITYRDFQSDPEAGYRVSALVEAMLTTHVAYTMEQIRDAALSQGAEARISTITYQSCACAHAEY